jgi:hypothetical protein
MKPQCDVLGTLKKGRIRQVVTNRFSLYEMHCKGKLKFKSHNTSYCLIEVVTKAALTVVLFLLGYPCCNGKVVLYEG